MFVKNSLSNKNSFLHDLLRNHAFLTDHQHFRDIPSCCWYVTSTTWWSLVNALVRHLCFSHSGLLLAASSALRFLVKSSSISSSSQLSCHCWASSLSSSSVPHLSFSNSSKSSSSSMASINNNGAALLSLPLLLPGVESDLVLLLLLLLLVLLMVNDNEGWRKDTTDEEDDERTTATMRSEGNRSSGVAAIPATVQSTVFRITGTLS